MVADNKEVVVEAGSGVELHFSLALANGEVIDSNFEASPAKFRLGDGSMLAGFEIPDAGIIEICGRRVNGPHLFVPPEKRRVGMVFQSYALFPPFDHCPKYCLWPLEKGSTGRPG